jgi:hypothetical protein
MEKSICKIKCNDGSIGTGFFCKIPFPDNSKLLPVLITNSHVLSRNDLLKDNFINISLDDDKYEYKIYIDESRKTYSNKSYDVSIIEITIKDNLSNVSFLEIDDNLLKLNDNEIFINKSIYLLHYPHGNDVELSIGVIKSISKYNSNDFFHLCQTQKGSSGCPIINLINFKVIGIHKGTIKEEESNLGTLIKGPIKEFIMIHNKAKDKESYINNLPKFEVKHFDFKVNNKNFFEERDRISKSVCQIPIQKNGHKFTATGFFF